LVGTSVPRELGFVAAEVAAGGGLPVDRAQRVEHLDDAARPQSKCSRTSCAISASQTTPVPSV
jgi:hypothetical protein